MSMGGFGLDIPPLLPPSTNRQMQLLRCLGRLEFLSSHQIKLLCFPDVTRQTMQNSLNNLLHGGLIWRIRSARHMDLPKQPGPGHLRPPIKQPYIYGLTHHGFALIDQRGVETDALALGRLHFRDPRGRQVDQLTLSHDMFVSYWCSSLLVGLRACPAVRSVFIATEFVVDKQQRMDALILIRLALPYVPGPRGGAERPPWYIPLFDGEPRAPDEVEVRLALEIDRSTEELRILRGKAAAYRDRSIGTDNVYNTLFGGMVLPVVIVTNGRRAGRIAAEWTSVWKHGFGIVSTATRADHRTWGTLWGEYLSLTDAKQSMNVLTTIVQDEKTRELTFQPVIQRREWDALCPDPPYFFRAPPSARPK